MLYYGFVFVVKSRARGGRRTSYKLSFWNGRSCCNFVMHIYEWHTTTYWCDWMDGWCDWLDGDGA
ncbi:hypothetical protein V6Z11_D13G039300 [Gossypium hirsutum]